MVASESFAEFLREQLARSAASPCGAMFGKTGVFCDGLMFGMVTDNTLYFRVDDHNRTAFEEAAILSAPQLREGGQRPSVPRLLAGAGADVRRTPKSWSRGRGWRWRRRAGSRGEGPADRATVRLGAGSKRLLDDCDHRNP